MHIPLQFFYFFTFFSHCLFSILQFACFIPGLCQADMQQLGFLLRAKLPWQVVLTKSDLLSLPDLERSIVVVAEDICGLLGSPEARGHLLGSIGQPGARIAAVSAASGAGVQALWHSLQVCAREASTALPESQAQETNSAIVQEHVRASELRGNKAHMHMRKEKEKGTGRQRQKQNKIPTLVRV
jgi:hypothetical protein